MQAFTYNYMSYMITTKATILYVALKLPESINLTIFSNFLSYQQSKNVKGRKKKEEKKK